MNSYFIFLAYSIKIVPSLGWISEGKNGTLTGSGSQVRDGLADISLDISKPVEYRAKDVTFLHAIKQDRVAIMFRQPEIQTYRNILVRPFKDGLWKRVLQSCLAILISTVLASRRRDFHVSLLPIIGAMLARGVSMANALTSSPKSLRIVILVASLFGLTMYSIYSAFIVSSLRRQAPPVKRFQDLLDNDYELLAQRSLPDFTNVFVSNPREGRKYAAIARKNFISEIDSLRRLFERGVDESSANLRESDSDDKKEGNSRQVAWFVLKSDFYYLALQNNYKTRAICDIYRLEPTSRSEHPRLLAMFMTKKTTNLTTIPLIGSDGMKEHFNRRILDLLARGLVHRHILRFESEFQPKCLRNRRIQVQQIRFYDVYAAFWILCYGAGIALGIMIVVEILFAYFWQVTDNRTFWI